MTSRYVQIARALPRPSPEHVAAFAEFVAGAHSWYKHLPLHPDVPFHFYVDPNAGRQIVRTRTNETAALEITDESQRFHYTWMTTKDRLKRFGHLAYHTTYGSHIALLSADGARPVDGPGLQILADDGDWVPVDYELAEAGTALLNALVHTNHNLFIFRHRAEYNGLAEFEEVHGSLEQLLKKGGHEAVRERLLERMRAAMGRFLDMVYGA